MKTNVTPRRARSFWRNIEGNVAPIFGLMAIPMLGVVGAAIDFGQAQSKASVLQSALDASVVSAIREYRDTGNASSAANRLRNHFSSELSGSGMTLGAEPAEGETASNGPNEVLLENVGINTASQSVSPKASVNVPTSILKLIGIDSIDLEVSSAATMAGKALELTMVLDVTGSMCPNGNCTKLNDMKTAAKDLLDIVMPDLDGGDVSAQMKSDPMLADVPILMVTALVSNSETGSDDVVSSGDQLMVAKPIKFDKLVHAIESRLAGEL